MSRNAQRVAFKNVGKRGHTTWWFGALFLSGVMLPSQASASDETSRPIMVGPSNLSAGSQALNPPPGDSSISEFGAAAAAFSDGIYDYVVIGAPGSASGGRVFYYQKLITDGTFGGPVELPQPGGQVGDRFGASVAIDYGAIVVGSPNHPGAFGARGRVCIYEQPRSSNFPISGSAFNTSPQCVSSTLGVDNQGFGSRVRYDFHDNVAVSCGSAFCEMISKFNLSWATYGGLGTSGQIFIDQGITTPILATSGSSGLSFYTGAMQGGSIRYTLAQTVSGGGPFLGIGGFVDRVLVGIAGPQHGQVAQYTKNQLSQAPTTQWVNRSDRNFTVANANPNFGAAIAMSGDFALVGDPSSSQGTVHRFQVNTNGTWDRWDDVWTETGTLGTFNDSSYGNVLTAAADVAVVGYAAGNTAYAFDIANPIPTVHAEDPTTHVTADFPAVGTGGQTAITVDPMCSKFQQDLDFNGSPPTCVDITTTSDVIGLATVCFPNSSGQALDVLRCRVKAACTAGSLCCRALPAVSGPNPICVQTDGFSNYAAGKAKDTDGDFVPNIRDNCPNATNFFQQDGDNDLIGDACDNCPGVPNQDQADADHDGIGNVCDPTPGTSAAVPAGGPLMTALLAVVLLVTGGLTLGRFKRVLG